MEEPIFSEDVYQDYTTRRRKFYKLVKDVPNTRINLLAFKPNKYNIQKNN